MSSIMKWELSWLRRRIEATRLKVANMIGYASIHPGKWPVSRTLDNIADTPCFDACRCSIIFYKFLWYSNSKFFNLETVDDNMIWKF